MGKAKKPGKQKIDLDELVPVYVPSLYEILLAAEKKKGSPLTEDEVVNLRDTATVVMMRRAVAESTAKARKIKDLDSAHAWEEWLKRRSSGR